MSRSASSICRGRRRSRPAASSRPPTRVPGALAPRAIHLRVFTDIDIRGAWQRRILVTLDGVVVSTIGKVDLVVNKHTVGCPEDFADVAELAKLDDG